MESCARLILSFEHLQPTGLSTTLTLRRKKEKEGDCVLIYLFLLIFFLFISTIDPNIPFTTTWFETYKDQLLEASSKGPVLVHCRDSSRAGTFTVF